MGAKSPDFALYTASPSMALARGFALYGGDV